MEFFNSFLFIGFPYAAIFVFIVGVIWRYRMNPFRISSLSSEFLEGKKLFFGAVPFHYGLIALFFGHLIAFLVPAGVMAWNAHPMRLLILEVTGFAFAVSLVIGITNLIMRRLSEERVHKVTTWMDVSVLFVLLTQAIFGMLIAVFLRWGSSWFAAVLTPYLWSLAKFNPDISAVASMHWIIKTHIFLAFLVLALFPFSRLMHVLAVPLQYLWRPYQIVMWHRNRKSVRDTQSGWNVQPPRNT